MSVKVVLSDLAIEQFFVLPIRVQEPLDERIERLAEIEAVRDRALPPNADRRRRSHSFTIDLEDDYWNEIKLETIFDPVRGEMQVIAIGFEIEEK